ncbi:MAG: YlxR family protein [Ruminococcaceae bacterium]|nr:YlxR family protein [Oscillospiraceae bacterium]
MKRIPLRKCLGCNESKPKNELIRILRSPEGEVFIDKTGKASGRGAYICNSRTCFLKAKKAKRIERSLEVAISEELFASLEKKIDENEDQA